MFEKVGFDVLKLQRVSIGGLMLRSLKKGQIREIPKITVKKLAQKLKKNIGSPRSGK